MLLQGGAVRSQSVLQSQVGAWDPAALQQATDYLHSQQSPAPDTYEEEAAAQDEQPVVSNPAMMQRLSVMARQPADAPSLRPFNMLGSPSIGPMGSLGIDKLGIPSFGTPPGSPSFGNPIGSPSIGPDSLHAMHGISDSHSFHRTSQESAGADDNMQARLQAELGSGMSQPEQAASSSHSEACIDWTAGAELADGTPPLASRSFAVQQSQPRKQAAGPRESSSSSSSSRNPFPGFHPVGQRNDDPPGRRSQPTAGSSGRSQLRQVRQSRKSALVVDPDSVSFEQALMQQGQNRSAAAASADGQQQAPNSLPRGHSTIAAHWPGIDANEQQSKKHIQQHKQTGDEHAATEGEELGKAGAALRRSGVQALTRRASQARGKAGASMVQRIRASLFGGKAAAAAAAQPGQVCGTTPLSCTTLPTNCPSVL